MTTKPKPEPVREDCDRRVVFYLPPAAYERFGAVVGKSASRSMSDYLRRLVFDIVARKAGER